MAITATKTNHSTTVVYTIHPQNSVCAVHCTIRYSGHFCSYEIPSHTHRVRDRCYHPLTGECSRSLSKKTREKTFAQPREKSHIPRYLTGSGEGGQTSPQFPVIAAILEILSSRRVGPHHPSKYFGSLDKFIAVPHPPAN